MKLHPAARLFPDMSAFQFRQLVADIKENGQIEDVLLCDGKLVDGRHRYKACRRLGIECKMVNWEDIRPSADASLVDYIISKNLHRRHMNKTQRAAVATDALPLREREAKKRMAAGGAKSKRGPAEGKGRAKLHDLKSPNKSESKDDSSASSKKVTKKAAASKTKTPEQRKKERDRESAAQVAKQLGVSPRYVKQAKAIREKAPEVIKLMKAGEISIGDAQKLSNFPSAERKQIISAGKRVGFARAISDHRAAQKPKANPEDSTVTDKDLTKALTAAQRQAERLNATLKTALAVATTLGHVPLRGPGSEEIYKLTQSADSLAGQLFGA